MQKTSFRSRKIADLIRHELAGFLKREIKDPRLQNLVITAVEVSPDLGTAKIFYTVMDNEEIAAVQQALAHAQGYVRHLLAQNLKLRYVPHIHFSYDESIKRAEKISSLIAQVVKDNESNL